jgi:hypothetical protein
MYTVDHDTHEQANKTLVMDKNFNCILEIYLSYKFQ